MFSAQPLGYPNPWACSLGAAVHHQPWQLERCSQLAHKHQATANTTATRVFNQSTRLGALHVTHDGCPWAWHWAGSHPVGHLA